MMMTTSVQCVNSLFVAEYMQQLVQSHEETRAQSLWPAYKPAADWR